MRLIASILALILALPIHAAERTYDFSSIWNDANQGGFTSPTAIITPAGDAESDFFYEYAYVPFHHGMKPLFCLRKGEASRAVKCFYVDADSSRGEVVVEAVIPRD